MTTDLHDRLGDLAARTPLGSPPPDLWQRGVRRRRVVAVGRVAVALVLVFLVGIGGWTWHQARPIEPARSSGTPHLPDRLFNPSPWLSAFGAPPGPLIALVPAARKSLFHTTDGLVGVTASSGQYGFLDLPPDAVMDAERPASPPSLSPDGRHVAFWTTGSPTGTPNTNLVGVTITGVGVYDTETGHVVQATLQTLHGLNPDLLRWADDHTLVLGLAHAKYGDEDPNSCCEGHWDGLATWDIDGTSAPEMLTKPMPLFVSNEVTSAGGGVLVWSNSGRRVHVIDPRPPGRDQEFHLSSSTDYAVLSPDHDRLAVVSNLARGRLLVGELPERERDHGSSVRLHEPTSARGFVRVVAWQDDAHVVVQRRLEERARAAFRLEVVDVSTGRAQVLVEQARSNDERDPAGTEFAAGLFSAPVAEAVPPPRPWSRRAIAIDLFLGLAFLGFIGWVFRVNRA
jgi:hypothetical protein